MKKIHYSVLTLVLGLVLSGSSCNANDEPNDPADDANGVVINGVTWATRNVDAPGTFAAKPEDSGYFYQWNREKGWPGTFGPISDWNSTTPSGITWEKANDPCPTGWRVPTRDEFDKLLNASKVSREFIDYGTQQIPVMKFTDKTTGKSIYLKPADNRSSGDGWHNSEGSTGYYWSSTNSTIYPDGSAFFLLFDREVAELWEDGYGRGNGFSIRPVKE